MSHEIEGTSFAYCGQPAWHGIGTAMNVDATCLDWQETSNTGYHVDKLPLYYKRNGLEIPAKDFALVRRTDNSHLDTVSENWHIIQNTEVWNFIWATFIDTNVATVETAGVLFEGQMIFILLKMKDEFDIVKGDPINNYQLFTNWFKYGKAFTYMDTKVRVVCNNTYQQALRGDSETVIRLNHSKPFNENVLSEVLNNSRVMQKSYKEKCEVLINTPLKSAQDLLDYYKKLFPTSEKKNSAGKVSPAVGRLIELYETQPGADIGSGTMYPAFNSVTHYIDHEAGRAAHTRLQSAWYGPNKNKKVDAMKLALEYAKA